MMLRITAFSWSLALVGFSNFVGAIPTPQAYSPDIAPGTPAGLRGDESLLGVTGEPLKSSDSPLVDSYDLAPGQKADPNSGFYFDFTKLKNPQPIRGDKGGTDPGPSMFLSPVKTPRRSEN